MTTLFFSCLEDDVDLFKLNEAELLSAAASAGEAKDYPTWVLNHLRNECRFAKGWLLLNERRGYFLILRPFASNEEFIAIEAPPHIYANCEVGVCGLELLIKMLPVFALSGIPLEIKEMTNFFDSFRFHLEEISHRFS